MSKVSEARTTKVVASSSASTRLTRAYSVTIVKG